MRRLSLFCKCLCILMIFFLIQCKPFVFSKGKRKKEPPKSELAKLEKEIEELEARLGLREVKREKVPEKVQKEGKKPEEILKELEEEMIEKEQIRVYLSEKYYELAMEYYKARELENAKEAVLKSIEHDPLNSKAKSLLENIKLELGEVTPGDIGAIARSETERIFAQIQGARFEVKKLYEEAITDFNNKKYKDAKLKFKRVLETLKWFPYELKLQDVEKNSNEYLKKIEEEIKKERFIKARQMQEEALKEAKAVEEKEIAYMQKQLAQLLKEIVYNLKAKNFIRARELIEQAEKIAPFDKKVKQLSKKVEEAEYIYKNKQLSMIKEEEEAKRKIIEEGKTVIPPEEFNFPSEEIWEQIKKRKPDVPVVKAKEETIFEREVRDNLRKLRIEELTFIKLDDLIKQLRDLAELQGVRINFNFIQVGERSPVDISVPEKYITGYQFPVGTGEELLAQLPKVFPDIVVKIVPGGVLFLEKTEQVAREEFVTKLYNIRDIVSSINTMTEPPRIQPAGGVESFRVDPLGGVNIDNLRNIICFEIKEYLPTVQSPEGEQQDICGDTEKIKQYVNIDNAEKLGVIAITAPEEAHLIVKEILKNIRQYSSILVSVETRFLLVTEDFIQDIGLDMRGLNVEDFNSNIVLSSFPNPPFEFFSRDIAKEVPTNQPGEAKRPPMVRDEPSAGIFREADDFRGRLENLLANDQVVRTLFRNILEPVGGLTLQYTLLGTTQIRAILRAVERDRRVKTLLGQNVVAHNGERVYFRNINKFRYVKKLTDQSATTGQPLLVVEAEDVVDGVFLDVRPIVDNDRKYIRLELEPQVVTLIPPPPDIRKIEFVAGTTTTAIGTPPPPGGGAGEIKRFIETPEREFQELKTSIVVPDGGTVLIGGLTGRIEGTARGEVPLLSKIPIIGTLFSRKIKGYQRRLLIILVTAKIIVPEEKE